MFVSAVSHFTISAASSSGFFASRNLIVVIEENRAGEFAHLVETLHGFRPLRGCDARVRGNEPGTVVLRAIGPSLAEHGIAGALEYPFLELRDANGDLVVSNNDWRDAQQAQIEATGIAPTDPRESAILRTLPAGNYTAIISGQNGSTGVALVEIYNID